ncbi:hypothetical protein LPB138_02030 [Urechidicola croceus]|uniref:Right handed beta helix domain-containing protein n=2 Tax=Urechidicola croceus TaxID=1850246 RepID=A0A1D8P4L3_9FLAO|nr:hypothetical protein LPB138_02030 [Urechidicola croceus]
MYAQTTVDNNAGAAADYADLQAAIDAAVDGDVIYIQQSSTSYGSVTLNKALTLVGRSHSDAGYKSTIDYLYLDEGASDSTIKGLDITSGIYENSSTVPIENLAFFDNDIAAVSIGSVITFNNILFQGNVIQFLKVYSNSSNILINNNIFTNAYSSNIYFGMTDTLLFDNNIIRGYYLYGVTIYNATTDGVLNINNCIFVTNWGSDVDITIQGGSYQMNNCLTYNYNESGTLNIATNSFPVNTTNNMLLNIDPLFTSLDPTDNSSIVGASGTTWNPYEDDLTLQADSPAIGAGSGGTDLGIYQGYNFKNFGEPTGIPAMKIESYSSTVPKNGDLTVTISAKAN